MLIEYGNGVSTELRVRPADLPPDAACTTLRGTDALLQDLSYTYDPAGNITHIRDDAQQTIYFNNQVVDADQRLHLRRGLSPDRRQGREHIGQVVAARDDLERRRATSACRTPATAKRCAATPSSTSTTRSATSCSSSTRPRTAAGRAATPTTKPSLIEPGKSSNRLSSTSGRQQATRTVHAYDAHGNMTAMPHLPAMEWDFRRPAATQVDLGGGGDDLLRLRRRRSAGAEGDREERRERSSRNGSTSAASRSTAGATAPERSRSNARRLHVMDDKQRIALVETRTVGDEPGVPAQLIRYQFGNHLGSAALELDGAGQIISYEEYYPYGSTSYQAGRSAAEVSLKRYRYTGKERDEETGLNYHGARYYAPWLGRWTSCDPIGIKDGLNA